MSRPISSPSSPRLSRLAVLLATVLASAALPARALDLTVEVSGVRGDKGFVAVALYSQAQGWLKQAFKAERVAAGERATIVFRDLPAGDYAFAVIHDENANGKLDTNVVGMPVEAYGFSRDARGHFGPPKWEDAMLKIDADHVAAVKLQ